jgi:hypothetical protein
MAIPYTYVSRNQEKKPYNWPLIGVYTFSGDIARLYCLVLSSVLSPAGLWSAIQKC